MPPNLELAIWIGCAVFFVVAGKNFLELILAWRRITKGEGGDAIRHVELQLVGLDKAVEQCLHKQRNVAQGLQGLAAQVQAQGERLTVVETSSCVHTDRLERIENKIDTLLTMK